MGTAKHRRRPGNFWEGESPNPPTASPGLCTGTCCPQQPGSRAQLQQRAPVSPARCHCSSTKPQNTAESTCCGAACQPPQSCKPPAALCHPLLTQQGMQNRKTDISATITAQCVPLPYKRGEAVSPTAPSLGKDPRHCPPLSHFIDFREKRRGKDRCSRIL